MSKSLEWRHMAAPLSSPPSAVGDDTATAAAEKPERRETALLVVVSGLGGHKLRGRDVIEKHNWRKRGGGRERREREREEERRLHCAIFFYPFPPSPALRVFFAFRLLRPIFPPAAAFAEICSAQKSLPFFGKMWQFMRSCRCGRGVSEPAGRATREETPASRARVAVLDVAPLLPFCEQKGRCPEHSAFQDAKTGVDQAETTTR